MVLIIILMDYFVISRWKKFCKSNNYNRLFYVVPFWVSGLMFATFAYSNYYNFFVFPVPEYIKWLNIVTSFWYLPKVLITPVLLISLGIKQFFKIIPERIKPKDLSNKIIISNSRRKFIGNVAWGFAGVPFIVALKGLLHTVNDLKIFRENIYLQRLPSQLDGLKIIQVSDLHFGKFMQNESLVKLKNVINSLNADLIFITGDFVNFSYKELDTGEDFLRGLNSVYGTYACLGNHDHYMPSEDHEKLIKRIRNTGVNLLINENRVLKINGAELNIASVDNYGSNQTFGNFEKAYEGLNKDNVTILLNHDPNAWESMVLNKYYTDITLSGHTHGGQVEFGFLGYEMSFAKVIYKHYKGLYNEGNQYLYVNRGIGVSGPPIRLGINPEITYISLKKPNNFADNISND